MPKDSGIGASPKPVVILKRLLDLIQRTIRSRLPFDGGNLCAVCFGRQHGAGFDRLTVHMHHAGAALAGIAAYMCPREPQLVAQK